MKRLDLRLTEEEYEAFEKLAEATGLNKSDMVKRLVQSGLDHANVALATGAVPEPKAQVERRPDTTKRFMLTTELMESGGEGKLWPVVKFVPFEDWQPGQSYWNEQLEYVWSGNLDGFERAMMLKWLLSRHGPYGVKGPFNSKEGYATVEAVHRVEAEKCADAWLDALKAIEDADAKGEKLWPVLTGVEPQSNCRAWLHFIRRHPGVTQLNWQNVCREIGISEEAHTEVRSLLTWTLTQRNGILIADYPFFGQ